MHTDKNKKNASAFFVALQALIQGQRVDIGLRRASLRKEKSTEEGNHMQNTILGNGLTVPNWNTFTLDGVVADLDARYACMCDLVEHVSAKPRPTFSDLVYYFEIHEAGIVRIMSSLNHLKSTRLLDFPNIKEVADSATKLAVDFNSFVLGHTEFYAAHVRFRYSAEWDTLVDDQRHVVMESIRAFERAGVDLSDEVKARIATVSAELSQLRSDFEDAVVNATDAWEKYIPDASMLAGLPESKLAMFAAHAATKAREGQGGGYLLSLQGAHVAAIMEYATDRALRKEVWEASTTRASDVGPFGGQWDNGPRIVRILALSHELATLRGFASYPEYSISTKMAASGGVAGVDVFISTLGSAARRKAVSERKALKAFAREVLACCTLKPWDMSLAARLQRETTLGLDDEVVRQYFPLAKVWKGFADLLNMLFDVHFERAEAPLPHPAAEFFVVKDTAGRVVAGFYADLFSRDGKRGGAWMDDCISRREYADGRVQYPVAHICANFQPPLPGKDAQLSHDEVLTLFHEGGHAFHHLLTKTRYSGTSMMHVEWDAIELPSQYMEEWCYDEETLRTMSAHAETGAVIPDALIEKIRADRHFNAGLSIARQSINAHFDWEVYKTLPDSPEALLAVYCKVVKLYSGQKVHPLIRMPHSFTHIFSGGYAAGYFSYRWADGLVADVAAAFREAKEASGEEGVRITALRYRNEILARGAERPFVESFRAFRGRDTDWSLLPAHVGLE